MEQRKRKYEAQMKHIQNNYKQFKMNLRFDVFEDFQKACIKNNTTPTTAIKSFINDYIKKSK